ncbi:hypothetical protein ABK040_004236 [Willaertia magna]
MLSFLDKVGYFSNKAIFLPLLEKYNYHQKSTLSLLKSTSKKSKPTTSPSNKLTFRKVKIAYAKEPILKETCNEFKFANIYNSGEGKNSPFLPPSLISKNFTDYFQYNDYLSEINSDKKKPSSSFYLPDDELIYLHKQLLKNLSEQQLLFIRDVLLSLGKHYTDGLVSLLPLRIKKKRKASNTKKEEDEIDYTNTPFLAEGIEPLDYGEVDLEFYINPKIISKSLELDRDVEGCLSFPQEFILIQRSKEVEIEYTNLFGERIRKDLNGFSARTFLHEYDHLDGINMHDRIIDKEKDRMVYGEDIFHYLNKKGELLPEFK